MLLSEALSLRASLQTAIDGDTNRLVQVAKVQEGDKPAEDPNAIIKDLNEKLEELQGLIIRINYTNQNTILADGESLTAKIARRDILKNYVNIYNQLMTTIFERSDRYGRQEIKYVTTVDATKVRDQFNHYSQQLREVDLQIQQANWQIELLDPKI